MSAWSHLPAHLVPASRHPDTGWREGGVLTIGTPASPETRLCACAACQAGGPHDSDCAVHSGPAFPFGGCDCSKLKPHLSPPPIVTIRPAGPHASELYVRTGDGSQVVTVALSYGLLINLLEDATAALRRCEETR